MFRNFVLVLATVLVTSNLEAQVTLNEVLINPPGNDEGREFIELRGPANFSLESWYVLVLDGDASQAGVVDQLVPLAGTSTGANGLLLIRDSAFVITPVPEAQTTVLVFDFVPNLENSSLTAIVGFGTPPGLGGDVDADNDGVLDGTAFSNFTVVDAVGLLEPGATADRVYAGALGFEDFGPFNGPTPAAHNPDALYRIRNADGSACAWVGGEVAGTGSGFYSFDFVLGEVFGMEAQELAALSLGAGRANVVPDGDGDGRANGCDACPQSAASATVIPDPAGRNVPQSLFPLSTGSADAVPFQGNTQFAIGVDDPTDACGITPGTPTFVLLAVAGGVAVPGPGVGCNTMTGTVQLLPPIFFITSPVTWPGPGSPAVHPLSIPIEAGLCGITLHAQGVFLINFGVLTWELEFTLG